MVEIDPFRDRHGPSGHWSGRYEHDTPTQAGRAFPIHATIEESGGRIVGLMSDEVTNFAFTLGKVLDNARSMGQTPAPVYDAILERHPDAIVESSLPATSTLRGRLRGEALTFVKTYEGAGQTWFRAGGRTFASQVRPRHQVHYAGRFDAALGVIEGTWEICQPGPFGRFLRRLGTGTFYLARVED
jgi:hypothetical protein